MRTVQYSHNYFAPCLLAGFLLFFPLSFTQSKASTVSDDADLKRAAGLFKERKYREAVPILERLVAANPTDDQAIFGLGVALVMIARRMSDTEEREQIVIKARFALDAAKNLGVEDFFIERLLKDLFSDDDEVRTKTVEDFATLWTLHPPLIFDNEPPRGIKLPKGYRHKNSRDFEGLVGGIIWKPGGLKIEYEFASTFQEDAVKRLSKSETLWRREKTIGDHRFKYALTKGNRLVITVLFIKGKESPIATFSCQAGSEMDIEEALTIVTGLKEESSHLLNR